MRRIIYRSSVLLLALCVWLLAFIPTLAESAGAEISIVDEGLLYPENEVNVLFIGNSKCYHNNLPEVYGKLVSAATGERVNVNSILYAGRSLGFHARAILAVIETRGDYTRLTDSQKKYFTTTYANEGIPAHTFSPYIYERYLDALYPNGVENGIPAYDYIIFQDAGHTATSEAVLDKESLQQDVISMFRALCQPYTIVTQYSAWLRLGAYDGDQEYDGTTMSGFINSVNMYEEYALDVNQLLEEADIGADVRLSRCGNTLVQYFSQYGESYAMQTEPLLQRLSKYCENDLLKSDTFHPTPLGTYLVAYSLYVTNYQDYDFPSADVMEYNGLQTTAATNILNGKHPGNQVVSLHLGEEYGLSANIRLMAAKCTIAANYDTNYGCVSDITNFRVTLGDSAVENSRWLGRAFRMFRNEEASIVITGARNYKLVHRPYVPSGILLLMNGSTFSYRGYGYQLLTE